MRYQHSITSIVTRSLIHLCSEPATTGPDFAPAIPLLKRGSD
ncbi:Unknown protein sequence [Pseudomonas amygdali pv. myricae]|nr:Unknown protein sequence [Pseudomonas amygdali pv. myricae]